MTVKVFVVDDKERVLGLAKSTIDIDESYGIRMANDGDAAIAACYAEKPDLIVVDMLMPKKDGATFCRELKESPEMHDVKITLLSVTAA
jgi:CheY-like chemotaxis protein